MIPFNKPYLTGKELDYIKDAVNNGKLSGNGEYTKKCQSFFESRYGFQKCLLTTSCTDALEMAALLCDLAPGDEVIIPSYTFVSTALAFVRVGAKVVFADSEHTTPNIDAQSIESLITPRTRVIVPVHYAGVACDMDQIMEIARKYGLIVVEDAAQAIDSYYKGRALGSIGHMAAFSFHETKNIISGEGGMLAINDSRFIRRAEIIWEKGTNRAEFFRGEVNKYGWCDIGSSFLPSEATAAFLWAQIENMCDIQTRRVQIWNQYFSRLRPLFDAQLLGAPCIHEYATNNGHIFYIVCKSLQERSQLIHRLKSNGVMAVFHYLSLHSSPYYKEKHDGRTLEMSDYYEDRLLRLPMYYELHEEDVQMICNIIVDFYQNEQ